MLCGLSAEGSFASFFIQFVWLYLDNKKYLTQPGNEDIYGKGRILSMSIITFRGAAKDNQALFIGVQWQNQRQWAQPETQGIPSEHQETLFYCKGN